MSNNRTHAEAFIVELQDLMRKHKVDTIYGIRTEQIMIQSYDNNWNYNVESIDSKQKDTSNASI